MTNVRSKLDTAICQAISRTIGPPTYSEARSAIDRHVRRSVGIAIGGAVDFHVWSAVELAVEDELT